MFRLATALIRALCAFAVPVVFYGMLMRPADRTEGRFTILVFFAVAALGGRLFTNWNGNPFEPGETKLRRSHWLSFWEALCGTGETDAADIGRFGLEIVKAKLRLKERCLNNAACFAALAGLSGGAAYFSSWKTSSSIACVLSVFFVWYLAAAAGKSITFLSEAERNEFWDMDSAPARAVAAVMVGSTVFAAVWLLSRYSVPLASLPAFLVAATYFYSPAFYPDLGKPAEPSTEKSSPQPRYESPPSVDPCEKNGDCG